MTVSELIDVLQEYDSDLDVHVGYNYGDHCRTWVAPKVNDVQETEVVWSEYHRMPKMATEDYEGGGNKTVVLLST